VEAPFLLVLIKILLTTFLFTWGSLFVLGKASAHFVNELDGIGMVVGAMKQFADDSPLQRRCCLLLAHFGSQKNLRATVQKANVGSLVGAALDNHPNDAELVISVKTFFDAMCP